MLSDADWEGLFLFCLLQLLPSWQTVFELHHYEDTTKVAELSAGRKHSVHKDLRLSFHADLGSQLDLLYTGTINCSMSLLIYQNQHLQAMPWKEWAKMFGG